MERLLTSWGSEVRAVPALAPALDMVRAGFSPDALIVDLRLADGASGIDAVKSLRRLRGSSLATLLVTGDANPGILVEARQLGMPVMFKPIRPAQLRAFLAQAFAAQCSPAALAGSSPDALHGPAAAVTDRNQPQAG
jgi:CheY-like chemotaxis protein